MKNNMYVTAEEQEWLLDQLDRIQMASDSRTWGSTASF